MKTHLTLILCCMTYFTVNATVYVVDNNINNTTAYSTIQEAVDVASDNDTIYIQPSSVEYANPPISKPLVLIGAGRHPNKQNHNVSYMKRIILDPGSGGTTIQGLVITDAIFVTENNTNNITITHCRIKQIRIVGDNIYIENCIIGNQNSNLSAIRIWGGNGNAWNNIVIQNCIIASVIRWIDGSGNAIRNNLFIPNSFYPAAFHVSEPGKFVIVENNIFYGMSPGNCFSCTFNNNITFQTSQDALPYGNNSGVDNLNWFENGFVNAPLPVLTFLNNFYSDVDVHLEPGAPGVGVGTDGNDIGLYGGSSPFSKPGEPPIPVVRDFTLENVTVPVDGALQISVSSSSPE